MLEKLWQSVLANDLIIWFGPVYRVLGLMAGALSLKSIANFSWPEYRRACVWMGLRSFHMVVLAAVFVASALVIQLIIELKKYKAEDLAGALISIGLLREIGPLVVGLAWCARVAAFVSEEAYSFKLDKSAKAFASEFILPRYLAAVTMAFPLVTYGLLIGFASAALVSPVMGGSSPNTFLHSATQAVHSKDFLAYFLKLVLINPTIAIFAACAAGLNLNSDSVSVAANAVTATYIVGFIANLAATVAIFLI